MAPWLCERLHLAKAFQEVVLLCLPLARQKEHTVIYVLWIQIAKASGQPTRRRETIRGFLRSLGFTKDTERLMADRLGIELIEDAETALERALQLLESEARPEEVPEEPYLVVQHLQQVIECEYYPRTRIYTLTRLDTGRRTVLNGYF